MNVIQEQTEIQKLEAEVKDFLEICARVNRKINEETFIELKN